MHDRAFAQEDERLKQDRNWHLLLIEMGGTAFMVAHFLE